MDTNVILECHRVGSWKALTGGYRVETVEQCVRETQVGAQYRRQEQRICKDRLVERLAAVHSVADRELAELAVRTLGIHLDEGERNLWAHAISRDDNGSFVDLTPPVCGPASGWRSGTASGPWNDS